MWARAQRVWLAVLELGALSGAAQRARAQPEAGRAGDELARAVQYEAPPPCPQRAEFIARIQTRTRTLLPPAAEDAPRLQVRIRVLADHVIGSISIEDKDGAVAGRRIRAATCEEAADALALIAALALDPNRRDESLSPPAGGDAQAAPAPDGERTSAGANASPGAGANAGAGADASGSTGDEGGARAGGARDRTARQPRDTGSSRPGAQDDRREDEVADAPAAQDDGPALDLATQRFVVTASGLALTGVLPDAAPGFALVAAYALQPRGWPELAVRGGFAVAPAATETYVEGVVTFNWWTALLALCSGLRDTADTTSLWLCAASELGRLTASAEQTSDARAEDRSWATLGPALLVQWEPVPPLVLQAGASVPFALVRDRFLLGDDVVHTANRLGVRADLGVGVRIW